MTRHKLEFFTPSMEDSSPPPDFHFDYEKTIEIFKLLADIRFKLLAFVPTIVGAAIALIGDTKPPGVMIGVGALGLCGTIGVLLYELRNSELYNQAIHRAKYLEGLQRFPISVRTIPPSATATAAEPGTAADGEPASIPGTFTGGVAAPAVEVTAGGRTTAMSMSTESAPTGPAAVPTGDKEEFWPENGGVFSERRRGGYDFLGVIPIKHDIGLGFVYSAAVAGWMYLIVRGLTAAMLLPTAAALSLTLGFAFAAGLLTWTEVLLHDHHQFKPVRPRREYKTPKKLKWTRGRAIACAALLIAASLALGWLAPMQATQSLTHVTPGTFMGSNKTIPAAAGVPPSQEPQAPTEIVQASRLLWAAMVVSIVSALAGLAMLIFSKDRRVVGGAVAVAGLTAASLLGGVHFKLDDLVKMENRFEINPSLQAAINRMGARAPTKIGDIRGFAPGLAEITDSMNADFGEVCKSWDDHSKDGGLLMLVGSTDRTPLNPHARQRYESNAGLARSRAETAKNKIHQSCGVPLQQIFTGITGPAYTPELDQGAPPSKGAPEDRHVEVWAFWNTSASSFEFKLGDKHEEKEDKRR